MSAVSALHSGPALVPSPDWARPPLVPPTPRQLISPSPATSSTTPIASISAVSHVRGETRPGVVGPKRKGLGAFLGVIINHHSLPESKETLKPQTKDWSKSAFKNHSSTVGGLDRRLESGWVLD